jgi:hypothetical protein
MANDRTNPDRDDTIEPEGVNPSDATAPDTPSRDPNDEIPVPIAMYPSEIDERAQVVEALREETNTNRDDDLGVSP